MTTETVTHTPALGVTLAIYDDCEESRGPHIAEMIEGEKGDCIAEVHHSDDDLAYARLFASTPALLAALSDALERLTRHVEMCQHGMYGDVLSRHRSVPVRHPCRPRPGLAPHDH